MFCNSLCSVLYENSSADRILNKYCRLCTSTACNDHSQRSPPSLMQACEPLRSPPLTSCLQQTCQAVASAATQPLCFKSIAHDASFSTQAVPMQQIISQGGGVR